MIPIWLQLMEGWELSSSSSLSTQASRRMVRYKRRGSQSVKGWLAKWSSFSLYILFEEWSLTCSRQTSSNRLLRYINSLQGYSCGLIPSFSTSASTIPRCRNSTDRMLLILSHLISTTNFSSRYRNSRVYVCALILYLLGIELRLLRLFSSDWETWLTRLKPLWEFLWNLAGDKARMGGWQALCWWGPTDEQIWLFWFELTLDFLWPGCLSICSSCSTLSRNFFTSVLSPAFFLKQSTSISLISSLCRPSILPLVRLLTISVQVRFRYGVSPTSISYKMMPIAQISDLLEYWFSRYDSGLMQAGEPTLQATWGFFSPTNSQKPKSAILACPRVMKMLEVFRSRCTIFLSSIAEQPIRIQLVSSSACVSLKVPRSFMQCSKSPPSQNSVTMQTLFLVIRMSTVLRMLGCFSTFRAFTQLFSRYFSTSFWIFDSSITLMAMFLRAGSASNSLMPLNTCELNPDPITSPGWQMKFFIFFANFPSSLFYSITILLISSDNIIPNLDFPLYRRVSLLSTGFPLYRSQYQITADGSRLWQIIHSQSLRSCWQSYLSQ